jgi:hypothetical protein
MDTRLEWINAAKEIRDNINAKILCPNCKAADLLVIDIPFNLENIAIGGERCLKCPICGKSEFILYRKPPDNWLR